MQRRRVVSDPHIMGGAPVFRDTRVPVHMISARACRLDTNAHRVAADLRSALVDACAAGPCHLHIAECRLEILREP